MTELRPEKLHVRVMESMASAGGPSRRKYTLTHSDRTGDLYLTIGPDYDREQIAGWYTRLMRDEVLAEWRDDDEGPALHVYCHVSGGIVFGSAGWRYRIFQHHLRQVLQAFRHGDADLFKADPGLDEAPVAIHFRARQQRYNRVEAWGKLGDYRLDENSGRDMPEEVVSATGTSGAARG